MKLPLKRMPSALRGRLTRREFARLALCTSAAAAVCPAILPASALGKNGTISPSNRLAICVIGCGPQGLGDMSNFLNERDCPVLAGCDVKIDQLEQARNVVNKRYENQDCCCYHDFRELLARSDIDACLIATPDHWHVL